MIKALEINKLSKTYKNGQQALKCISFSVNEGDFYGLLGPNGAGKSTTIGIITSLVNKTAGTVKVFGYDIDKDLNMAKRHIGVVPQEFNFNIFETVEQIVVQQAGFYGIPRPLALERAKKYLKQLGLWDKRHVAARLLSGGMKRRLMIARALMHEPKLLILDEPTAGVDIELRRSMWTFLEEINKAGTTVILTTHYLEEAEALCRHIGIIHEGNMVIDTNKHDLLKQLSTETFILYLKQNIKEMPPLVGFNCKKIDDTSLEVEIEQHQSLNELFRMLSNAGLEISSMRNKRNRLEEMFVKITTKKT
ncbi:MAG: ABC transporter ATP-binding protein [Gammaproteobacteria bacterium]